MKKILVVSEKFWPYGSGGALATYLISDLLRRSFFVKVITGTANPQRLPKVDYIYEPLMSSDKKLLLWLNEMELLRSRKLRRLIEWSDVVYVPGFSFPVIPLARRLGKKVIVHLHGYIPVSYTAVVLAPFEVHKSRIIRDDFLIERMKSFKHFVGSICLWWLPKIVRKWIAESDTVICVSNRHAQIISTLAPELKGKIKVLYNPPPDMLEKVNKDPEEKPTFLYVGGDSYVKGFHVLIEALWMLGKSCKNNFKLVLAGEYNQKSLTLLNLLKRSTA